MTSLNERAWYLVEQVTSAAEELSISWEKRPSGTMVVDAGIHSRGSISAGLAMARISMSGLAEASLDVTVLAGRPWQCVAVASDQPLLGCYLSQSAAWHVSEGEFQAMGSGPACLLNQEIYSSSQIPVNESCDHAVLVLETRHLPDDQACRAISHACGVIPSRLALVVAPTSSLAGSAQIAARSIETALHKLHHLGFDLHNVASGAGRCPIAIPCGDDWTALGRTNDLMINASQVWLGVHGVADDQLQELVTLIPASSSPSHGQPFLALLSQAGGFYAIDPGLFAPAQITLSNLESGRSFHNGAVDENILAQVLNG